METVMVVIQEFFDPFMLGVNSPPPPGIEVMV
jgi:hypothetical protein